MNETERLRNIIDDLTDLVYKSTFKEKVILIDQEYYQELVKRCNKRCELMISVMSFPHKFHLSEFMGIEVFVCDFIAGYVIMPRELLFPLIDQFVGFKFVQPRTEQTPPPCQSNGASNPGSSASEQNPDSTDTDANSSQ